METSDLAVLQLAYSLDTFYFVMMAALVMFMAAGFAMLESGLVRAKNTTEILVKNVLLYSIACTCYFVLGYQLMYGGSGGGVLPTFGFGLSPENTLADIQGPDASYYSNASDFLFQVVFVATSMSIISGAVAERMKLWVFLLFAVPFTAIVYPLEGMWTWGGGWLSEIGFSDFAGSGIVHMAGAAGALAGVLLLGARKGKYTKDGRVNPILGANMPVATLGMFILWFGWFGFNGGSQLQVSGLENANAFALVIVNTNAAACAGALGAAVLSALMFKKTDLSMVINGALAGLVAITADPASPSTLMACIIGAIAGMIVVASVMSFDRLRIDDPVGAISVHGVCGIFGLLMVPFSNADAGFGAQLVGIVAIFAWCFGASLVLWFVLDKVFGLRISDEEEYNGIDITECGSPAYADFMIRT